MRMGCDPTRKGNYMQVGDSAVELNVLLAEPPSSAEMREATALDQFMVPGAGPVLFGAGRVGRRAQAALREGGVEPVAFADNNPALWGSEVAGTPVMPPAEAARLYGGSRTFFVTIWQPGHSHKATKGQLMSLGCTRIASFLPIFWRSPQHSMPHYAFDLPHRILRDAGAIRAAFALLFDEKSRRCFVDVMRLRLLADFDALPDPSPNDQFFPTDLISLSESEVFVACGAYDGDTIEAFVSRARGHFRGIVAFEPDVYSFSRLAARARSIPGGEDRLRLVNAAVGSVHAVVRFEASGSPGSALSEVGGHEVSQVPLDLVLGDSQATFLKMDIEGAEFDALMGARKTIECFRPTVAVCVYHRPADIWRIPLYLASLVPGYRFFLRAHGEDGLDTVLYAVPPKSELSGVVEDA